MTPFLLRSSRMPKRRLSNTLGVTWRKVALSSGLILVVIQLLPLAGPDSPGRPLPPLDKRAAPLLRACRDCHSEQTRWPWYSHLAPVSWWLRWTVDRGRERLNWSAWSDYTKAERLHLRRLVVDMIEEQRMPPPFYRSWHDEAELTRSELEAIRAWATRPGGGRQSEPSFADPTPSLEG